MTFLETVAFHRQRYPQMLPQDYGKLTYQNSFGAEHWKTIAKKEFLLSLQMEWNSIPADTFVQSPEDIGNGLCRFHLTQDYSPERAAPLLANLFYLTGNIAHCDSGETFSEKLSQLETLEVSGMSDWLSSYRTANYPMLHHSQIYREIYHPHYRVLAASYAWYFPILLQIDALAQKHEPVIIAIDGRCGSGKTALADLIAQLFPCNVFHMDDYYLPISLRADDWRQIPAGNIDLTRFRSEVLNPARSGQAVYSRPYDCHTGSFLDIVLAPPRQLTVVEGSYVHHPSLRYCYDLQIFLTCNPTVQASRLRDREGASYAGFVDTWIPMEERYLQRCHILQAADAVIDTSNFF